MVPMTSEATVVATATIRLSAISGRSALSTKVWEYFTSDGDLTSQLGGLALVGPARHFVRPDDGKVGRHENRVPEETV